MDAEQPHLRLIKEGVITTAVGQKRELFTYLGLRTLFELNPSPIKFCADVWIPSRSKLWESLSTP